MGNIEAATEKLEEWQKGEMLAPEQKEKIESRTAQVRQWLLGGKPDDTEDRVFRLRALRHVAAEPQVVENAREVLLASQRDDGGWAQTSEMESDPYATATVLVALLETGEVPRDAPVVRRGVEYLTKTQGDDGSWHVTTRAKPFQVYYESGFPHEKDQFISISATGWATLALLLTLPAEPE